MQKFEKHSPVVVTEVTTKHELRQFMQYPNRLYADNPNYIPSFYGDDLSDWTPGKNPAFDYCEARCWLARRDGEIVGRIGAILSHKANDKFGRALGARKGLRPGARPARLHGHGPRGYARRGL